MRMVFLLGKCRYKKKSTCVFVSSLLWCHVTSLFTRSFSRFVNRWCNLVSRLLVPSTGKTGLARYSRGDGEAFVQDLWHIYNTLDGTEDDAVFDENIPEQKNEDEEMDRQRGRRRAIRSIPITQQHEPPSNKSPYYTNNNFSSFYK